MNYLAIPQATVNWLLMHPTYREKLHNGLFAAASRLRELAAGVAAAGPLRIAGATEARVVVIWNADYLSGTGEEQWGFIKLARPLGILERPEIGQEVLERCLYVVNQRLQGLLLDGAFIHRAYANNAQTCLAGRGVAARQFSIGYFEADSLEGSSKAVICVGPGYDFDALSNTAVQEAKNLGSLCAVANGLCAPGRRRPVLETDLFADLLESVAASGAIPRTPEASGVTVAVSDAGLAEADVYRTLLWTYDEWVAQSSPLSTIQRRVLESDVLQTHPLRLIGPAGAGKTLIMQLLALRMMRGASVTSRPCSILYIVHNAAMSKNVIERFDVLGGTRYLAGDEGAARLSVATLSEYSRNELQLDERAVIDPDAHETKEFQLETVAESLKLVLGRRLDSMPDSRLLTQASQDAAVFGVLARLVMAEISIAIKGHGLMAERARYVHSERHLSRLHGLLKPAEREFVFEVFEDYHHRVFDGLRVLDSDDVAISLLGRLRTPIWDLKRSELGFDFVFVDEAQLFNDNERRIFPLLTRGTTTHVPVALALDEAQEFYGHASAGLGALGIESIASESLPANHRSTPEIARLAFFIIERTTDLFGFEFPRFSDGTEGPRGSGGRGGGLPQIERCAADSPGLGRSVVRKVRALRRANFRQVAVVCHAEPYWGEVRGELMSAGVELRILEQRGERIDPDKPVVVYSRPAHIGGQEFDAVVAIGLEQGLVPPRILNNEPLAAAVYQQALREMYLSFTRARRSLTILIAAGAAPSPVLHDASQAGLLAVD